MQQNSRRLHPIIWFVILLAVVGILYQLISKPGQLITTLLIGAAVIAVFYFIFNRTSSSGINGKYKKAVKQSKKRYGSNNKQPKASPLSSNKKAKSASQKKRVREHNLTVIEGKKSKKKNRASF
ncbi:SA1362 family protein [Bacillus sp. NEB1478]|uniref:SA1362 family protein n=1 Tax=Bacillus sp. NEB1478 TaxID=3073816 RepID=UPI002873453C|nr:SA1362 family protein [Bacillus sp. NEB1478]WNB93572.1 SA1362 family protein [Bacillus sp. NEB1478]